MRRSAAGLFFLRLEHSSGSACDKAPRNQAFAVCTEIIPKAGNDIAFSCGKSPKAGPRHFLCRLRPVDEFVLTCDDMEFGFRGARAQCTNTDSVRLQFFRQSLDRKSTRLNSSHDQISYAVFCLK